MLVLELGCFYGNDTLLNIILNYTVIYWNSILNYIAFIYPHVQRLNASVIP